MSRQACRYRIARITRSWRPWVVQRNGERRTDWIDIARFPTEDEARTYIANILDNQFRYLERQPL